MTRFSTALLAVLLCSTVLAACGDDGPAPSGAQGGLDIVATTTQAADLARAVAGERDRVTGLLTPNSDPHAYEIRPGDVERLADADVVIRSGGDLDDWLEDAIDASGNDAEELVLIDHVNTIEGAHGHEDEHAADEDHGAGEGEHEVDPHWWQDPRNAERAVAAIAATLSEADPDGAAAYEANAAGYTRKLRALDEAVAACIDAIPVSRRKLVTTHDALGPYARRYGLEVIGTVIPSRSTQGQASAGEVAELVDTIRRERVAAIFTESSVDAKVEAAIAREAGAAIGRPLWADTLGPAGSDGATYLRSIAANTRAIVDGLGAGAADCSLPG